MKKTFEFVLIIIIFYGIYSLFDGAASYLFKNPKNIWVIITALVVSAFLLFMYKLLISSEVKGTMKKHIDTLKTEIEKKEDEIKKAKSFKEDLIKEAEESISKE